ncbi:MAG: hypothetical protein ACYC46_16130 [Acidobacteriaceae bacterium]
MRIDRCQHRGCLGAAYPLLLPAWTAAHEAGQTQTTGVQMPGTPPGEQE